MPALPGAMGFVAVPVGARRTARRAGVDRHAASARGAVARSDVAPPGGARGVGHRLLPGPFRRGTRPRGTGLSGVHRGARPRRHHAVRESPSRRLRAFVRGPCACGAGMLVGGDARRGREYRRGTALRAPLHAGARAGVCGRHPSDPARHRGGHRPGGGGGRDQWPARLRAHRRLGCGAAGMGVGARSATTCQLRPPGSNGR